MRETHTPPDHFEPFGPMLVCVEHIAFAAFALAGLVGCAMADPLWWDAYIFTAWLGGVMLILLTTAVCWHSACGHASLIWPVHLAWRRRVRNADRALASVDELAVADQFESGPDLPMSRPAACRRCGYNIAYCHSHQCPECGQPILGPSSAAIRSLPRIRREQPGAIVALIAGSLVMAFIWVTLRHNYLAVDNSCGPMIMMETPRSPYWELLDLVPIMLISCLGLLMLWLILLAPLWLRSRRHRVVPSADESAGALMALEAQAMEVRLSPTPADWR